MIEILEGIKETVNFKKDAQILFYYNDEAEDYPAHWHIPLEIIMPIKNGYDVTCNDTHYHLNEQDILIVNSGVIHEITAPDTGERIILLAKPGFLRQIKDLDTSLASMGSALLITPDNLPATHDMVVNILLTIKEEHFSDHSMAEAYICSKLIEFFVHTGRNYASSDKKNEGSCFSKDCFEKIHGVCKYINEHFTEKLTLEAIAQQAGFSKFHFSHLFKEYTHTSFYKYVNHQRIQYASTLLADPSLSIAEIAIRSGFESFSSFNRMFKLLKGCTPSEFRDYYQP
ncbi:MAG: helix-turn-helix transcriptional regulator [Lachnospiraceae bacterium]|nr:helix-turn-helix transcriptional regulator [Lachnospiraceae bacterium]